MIWNSFATDYLSFSKKDRIGLLFLLFVMVLLYLLPSFFNTNKNISGFVADTLLQRKVDSLKITAATNGGDDPIDPDFGDAEQAVGFRKANLFYFDPNTLDKEGWRQLGLKEKTIKTLMNYRDKGGRFYKKEDLKKIWGLPAGFYDHVQDHIQLAVKENGYAAPSRPYPTEKKERQILTLELNSADSTALESLPGIGSRLAQRILNFREKLGGFYTMEQVAETYGLPDSTFQKLKPYFILQPENIRRININTATKDELKIHPYIRWNLANAIVEYRNQHGLFKDISELKRIVLVDEATFRRISPYLVTE